MLIWGHFDLNSVPFCSDSLKERIKQTMIDQNLVFMGQVAELHRLYRVQIEMTEDFKRRGSDNKNCHVERVNSFPLNNSHVKLPVADIVESQNYNKQHDLLFGAPGCKKKHLDLQLSADDFICQYTYDLFERGALDLDKSNLALSIGGIVEDHNVQSVSRGQIRHLNEGATSSRSLLSADLTSEGWRLRESGSDGDSRAPDFLTSHKRSEPSKQFQLDLNTAPLEDSPHHSNDDSVMLNPLVNILSSVSEMVCSNSAVISSVCPTSWRESKVSHSAETSDIPACNDAKTSVAQDLVHTVVDEFSNGSKSEPNGGKPIFIDLVSDSDEELCTSSSGVIIEGVASSSKLSNGLSCEIVMGNGVGTVADVEKDKKDAVLSQSLQKQSVSEPLDCDKLSSSCESEFDFDPQACSWTVASLKKEKDSVVISHSLQSQSNAEPLNCNKVSNSLESRLNFDHQPCGLRTLQPGVTDIDLNFSASDDSQMVDVSPIAVISGVQKLSESPESKIHGCSKEAEVDGAARTAAESLLQISLEKRASHLDGLAKLNSMNSQTKEDDQPQYSCDSYEEMVLNAKECSPDDYCISSNAFIVDDSEKKGSGYKLKRGTRMKDFQKEILPCLSTLGRHEIREDIHIIEGAIRSRESRKMSAKTGDGSNWCRSTRSKRSRIRR